MVTAYTLLQDRRAFPIWPLGQTETNVINKVSVGPLGRWAAIPPGCQFTANALFLSFSLWTRLPPSPPLTGHSAFELSFNIVLPIKQIFPNSHLKGDAGGVLMESRELS